MRPQCDHREPPVRGRRLGRRCRIAATRRLWVVNSDQGGNFCGPHAVQRAKAGVRMEVITPDAWPHRQSWGTPRGADAK